MKPGARWHTREDSGLRLDPDGQLWHDGERIENENVSRAFHRGLERAPDGRYLIRFGPDWAFLAVDDAPYQVLGLFIAGEAISLRLDDETQAPLDPAALSVSEAGVLYARVRGACEARFSRAAQGQLAPLLSDDGGTWVLRLGAAAFPVKPRVHSGG